MSVQNLKFRFLLSIENGGKNKNILPVTEYERSSHP
jgi:hypothetical protein